MKNKHLEIINPTALFDPTPFGFSHSIAVESPLKMVFIAGQSGGVGHNHILTDDFKTQVKDALKNLEIILVKNQMSFEDIVKITLLIVNHDQQKLEIWSEEAKKTWKNQNLPTSTLIPVASLALPNMLFEIDAVAIKKIQS